MTNDEIVEVMASAMDQRLAPRKMQARAALSALEAAGLVVVPRDATVESAIRADERAKVIEEATNAAVIAIGDVDWISIADRGELQCVVGPAIRALREKKP